MNRKEHWENIYTTKADDEVSWTQREPEASLLLIREVASSGRVIDVGSGTSILIERLLDSQYSLTVLDISQAALNRARQKLGERALYVRWVVADITTVGAIGEFDVWHDRAVFHFLTAKEDRQKYVQLAAQSIPVGGHLIVGTFALDGPEKCSGLVVERYDRQKLIHEFGEHFAFKREHSESHSTPWGKLQHFYFAVFERTNPGPTKS